ncbi:DNA polymerase III subunit alpha [Ureaplasma diversum]|uniref:DNA polymerase III subunit alpha n=1 Tax=Ureaplasma diversum TaxID=42094 RepID=UPI000AFDDD0B|nr:DNA polymerase III subunit alpha [Ureaplasma diversum]
MFVNLHARSHYSLLQSTLKINDLINFALEQKQSYVSLCDFENMYGCIEFYDKAKKANLKPIVGIEFNYLNTNLLMYALNYEGYLVLVDISSKLLTNQPFSLDLKDLENTILIATNHGISFDHNNFYQSYDSSLVNYVAVNLACYLNKEDKEVAFALKAIANDKKIVDYEDDSSIDNAYLLTETEAKLIIKDYEKGIDNLNQILNKIDLEIKNQPINIPTYDPKSPVISSQILRQLCYEGLAKRLNQETNLPEEYTSRLDYELDIIIQKQFEDYFLIVYDFIDYARSNNIMVGPGRGSAAGSLVAYCLYITQVDPVKNNLIFERFLNPTRISMPDIDTDIMDSRRDEVIEYLFNKYSNDHVAYIVTFGRMKAKMAIRDVGRILGFDQLIINNICKNIKEEYNEDLDQAIVNSKHLTEANKMYKQLFTIAKQLINTPRNISTHAAGIILSKQKLSSIIPVQIGINDRLLSQYSMEYLERFGLIKMDLLGLINLTTLDNVIKQIKRTQNKTIDLAKINYNDKNVFDDLSQAKTEGIFQLESYGMRRVLKQVKPRSVEDISIVSALFRPGAQKHINEFVQRRFSSNKNINYWNETTKKILEPTYGIIVYQEQVIQLTQAIANFDAAKSDNLRRAISKKDEKALASFQSEFINAAINNGFNQNQAISIFNNILEFANYGFNRSHSLAYSYISYWLAYLKHYYSIEFLATLLNSASSKEKKLLAYIKEAKYYGIKLLGPNFLHSVADFRYNTKTYSILFGFKMIKGVGEELIKKILSINDRNQISNYTEAVNALRKAKVTVKNIELLIKAGAFDVFLVNRRFLLNNLEIIYENTTLPSGLQTSLNGIEYANDLSINQADDLIKFEEDLLGIRLADLNAPVSIINEINGVTINHIDELDEDGINIIFKINYINNSTTKANKPIFYINGICNSTNITLTIFHSKAVLVTNLKQNNSYVLKVKKWNQFIVVDELIMEIKDEQ